MVIVAAIDKIDHEIDGNSQKVEDIEQLVNVIKNYKYGEPLNDKFFKTKFEEVPLAFDWRAPKTK